MTAGSLIGGPLSAAPPIEGFKALAHPVRYRIMRALAEGERNVGELEEVTGFVQPGLSQQLAVLRKAQLVTTRRKAKQIFYAIAFDEVDKIAAAIAALTQAKDAATDPAAPRGTRHYGLTGAAVFAMMNG